LKEIYQDITVHVEDKYDYLGMIMPHDWEGQQIEINMERYIK
jgi:hypothetical protein